MISCPNVIVNKCINLANVNACTPCGYKLAYYRDKYGLDVLNSTTKYCLKIIRKKSVPNNVQLAISNEIRSLLYVNADGLELNEFDTDELDELITFVSTN
jgi:hypothetical protein